MLRLSCLLVAGLSTAPNPAAAQPVLVSTASTTAGDPAPEVVASRPDVFRSETLLTAWATGDVAPTIVAFAPELQDDGAVFVRHLVRTLSRRHGAIMSVTTESAIGLPEARTSVVVRVQFERGQERLRLVWTSDLVPQLRSVARASPEGRRPVEALTTCAS